jgi:NADH:ubiquinone oxidoreductase subunit 5 (subunit L)/multisubunit Na+/H+ antiporter MnhA subunit
MFIWLGSVGLVSYLLYQFLVLIVVTANRAALKAICYESFGDFFFHISNTLYLRLRFGVVDLIEL